MWAADWISLAYDPRQDLGVFAFRRRIILSDSQIGLPVRVSADNRYKLYCNGRLVGTGPQRGDERHWFYETYDLAPFLRNGENELVALVWNFGWMAPMAQHTVRTGFVFEDLRVGGVLSTGGEWQVGRVPGWDFDMMHSSLGGHYIDVGPGEVIHGSGAQVSPDLALNLETMEWRKPHSICRGEHRGDNGGGTQWMTIPATLPPQRYRLRKKGPVVRKGPSVGSSEFEISQGKSVILDFEELLCAYPRLRVKGPAGTALAITYAETPWVIGKNEKGNRNDIEGKEIRGYQDKFILSGGEDVFEPLWWRTFRYVEITVLDSLEGGASTVPPVREPDRFDNAVSLTIEAYETGYPYDVESSFKADDPWVKPIWDVAVRTAERCAGETYFDCPYYEQLQYVGDSRIQALVGYYLGRDRRLQRNCIEQIGWSIMENGLTQSRYPSRQTQVIPPFSLWWVMMMYDQMLYDTHRSFEHVIAAQLMSDVVDGFNHEWAGDGRFWNFGDWVHGWNWGVPPGGAHATMHRLLAEMARLAKMERISRGAFSVISELMDDDDDPVEDALNRFHERISEEFISERGLIRDELDEEWRPNEHAEALYRIYQTMAGLDVSPWPFAALERANADRCTYYFSYYKHLAMCSGPNSPHYMELLTPWKEQIENGLTTFAENPEPTRSDCHAWSAHPILGFFQIVAGVTSVAPGWKRARIAPQPGDLRRFDARIAHLGGELRVQFEDGKLLLETPVPATLLWLGKEATFEPGSYRVG